MNVIRYDELLERRENSHLPLNTVSFRTDWQNVPDQKSLLYRWIEISTEIPEFIPQIFASSKLEVSSGSKASRYSFSNSQGHRRPNPETTGRGRLATPYLKNVNLGNLMFSKL